MCGMCEFTYDQIMKPAGAIGLKGVKHFQRNVERKIKCGDNSVQNQNSKEKYKTGKMQTRTSTNKGRIKCHGVKILCFKIL